MNVQEQIKKYISSQPEPNVVHARLHRLTLQVYKCKLWFDDGKKQQKQTISNPTMDMDFYTIKYTNGKT